MTDTVFLGNSISFEYAMSAFGLKQPFAKWVVLPGTDWREGSDLMTPEVCIGVTPGALLAHAKAQ